MTIGPPLPPGFKRSSEPSIDSSVASPAEAYTTGPSCGLAEPRATVKNDDVVLASRSLGPALPPDVLQVEDVVSEGGSQSAPIRPDRANATADRTLTATVLPHASSTRGAIGPPLPPEISDSRKIANANTRGGDWATNARKREWELAREDDGDGKKPESEREEWMLIPPEVDRSAVSLAPRGFNSRAAAAAAEVGREAESSRPKNGRTKAGVPIRPGDAEYADAEPKSVDENSSDDGGFRDNSFAKRQRSDDGPSLLELHRTKAGAKSHGGPFKQWDREAEFVVNHKKRGASYYTERDGGLGSRYSSGSGR